MSWASSASMTFDEKSSAQSYPDCGVWLLSKSAGTPDTGYAVDVMECVKSWQ
jgi:hypothetical protein